MPSLTAKNVGNYLLNINLIKLLWHYSQIIPVIIHSVFTERLYTVQKTGTPERKCTNKGPVSTQARQRARLAQGHRIFCVDIHPDEVLDGQVLFPDTL